MNAFRTVTRTALAAATAVAISVPLLPTAHADSTTPTGSGVILPPDLAAAQSSAMASDSPTVVDDQTTETDQVTALPDGTFELDAHAQPVRVRAGAGWTPIDTTLHQLPDGTIAPAAIDADVKFSGGGSGPAIVLGDPAHQLKLTLPTSLPTPVLNGPTATYSNVYPGIDLDLTANATGYTEVLVIKDAAAAANPVLRDLDITTSTTGLDLTRGSDGNLTTDGGDAATNYTATAPIMWDSSSDPTIGPAPTAVDPGSARVTPLTDSLTTKTTASAGDTAATGELTVSAPADALTGSSVTYPLYLDPGFSAGATQWLTVSSGGLHHYKSTQKLMVGRCQVYWSGCGSIGVARSFFTLNLSTLSGGTGTAHISSASIAADEIWNAYSSPTPVDLLYTKPFTSSTTWPGPDTWSTLQSVSSDNGHDNGKDHGDIFFNNSNVLGVFQNAATKHYTSLTFGLKAPSESTSSLQWKQFDTNPSATVYFDFAPSTPNHLAITSNQIKCPGKPVYSTTSSPTFVAHSDDNNPSGHTYPVGILFHLDKASGSTLTWDRDNKSLITANSAGNASWNVTSSNSTKTSALTEGTWKLAAKATSLSTNSTPQSSPWSGWFSFTYDHTAPATPSGVVNSDGTITISAPGAAGIVWNNAGGKLLTLDASRCNYNSTTASGGFSPVSNGIVKLPAPPATSTDVVFEAFDDAHNLSKEGSINLVPPPPAHTP